MLEWLFKSRRNVPDAPDAVDWPLLPPLSVVVFGTADRTPDTQRITDAMLALVSREFPNPIGITEYHRDKVEEKLQIQEAPAISEMGATDRASRLFSLAHALRGMVWLLLEEGATISEADAGRIPAVLSEFVDDDRCAVVQGNGYHAFVREEFMMGSSIRTGRLADAAVRAGAVAKRVRYITLDSRRKASFKL